VIGNIQSVGTDAVKGLGEAVPCQPSFKRQHCMTGLSRPTNTIMSYTLSSALSYPSKGPTLRSKPTMDDKVYVCSKQQIR
jgi:hypothetical protein